MGVHGAGDPCPAWKVLYSWLFSLSRFKDLLYEYFCCMSICASYVYLVPLEVREGAGPLRIRIMDNSELLCMCWVLCKNKYSYLL